MSENLRIVDAPLMPQAELTEDVKIPTGGKGNFSVNPDMIAEYTVESKDLADKEFVNNSSNGVRQLLEQHLDDENNPHGVTKSQVGLGNVDNTSDLNKPISNATQSALNSKADSNNVVNSVNGQKGAVTVSRSSLGIPTDQEIKEFEKEARFVTTDSDQTQQEINDFGGYAKYKEGRTYSKNQYVMLDNGDVVKAVEDGVSTNPNVDMMGWVRVDDSSQIFDSDSGLDQKSLNNIFKSTKYINIRYFGVYQGLSDDLGVLINTADSAARSLGCGLYFPSGTYLATGLLPTVSWCGDGKGKTIIKNHGTNVNTGFCLVKNNSEFRTYEGITFDGSVSADPLVWDSTNYNTFTGAIPLVIDNSSRIILSGVECKSAKMSDLRITGSTDVFLFDIDMEKARGNFGDGIYIGSNSKRIFGDRVNIKDVTRIGLVFEGGTTHCRFRNLNIENAHDGSNAYSGTEFNGGVWAENASHIFINDADAKDTRDYGFLMTTGAGLSGIAQAYFELRNCTSEGASTGFLNRSKPSSIPASHKLFNCKAKSYMPFLCNPRYDSDTFEYYNCDAFITGSVSTMSPIHAALFFQYDVTFTNKRSKVTVRDFTIGRDISLDDYSDTAKYDCDITFYTGNYFDLLLDNISTSDGSPVYIKNRLNVATNDKTRIRESKVDFKGFRTTDLKTTDCELSGTVNNSTGKCRFNNTEIKTKLSLTSHDFRFNDLDCDFSATGDFLEILSINATPNLVGKINNAKFKKDITSGDYSLKFQAGTETTKAKILVANTEFYNSGAENTTTNTHVWVVRSPSSMIYQSVIRDDFASMQKVNTTVSTVDPNGVTSLTIH